MNPRRLIFILLLLAIGMFTFIGATARQHPVPLLDGLDTSAVSQIEISHGGDLLLLVRDRGADGWQIRSAADAPGNNAMIAALLAQIRGMEGWPDAADAGAADADEDDRRTVQLRLMDASGDEMAWLGFSSHHAMLLPDGQRLRVAHVPALPLWPSAWSSLRPPAIDSSRILAVERLTPAGLQPLDAAGAADVGIMLQQLNAQGFVPSREVDWRPGRMLRVRFVDRHSLDLAQVPDGEGRFFLRLASSDMPAVKAVERFAFRTAESLP